MDYEDIRRLAAYRNQTVLAVKAPEGSTLEVPNAEEVNSGVTRYQIHVRSSGGPIYCVVVNGRESWAPPPAYSWPAELWAKEFWAGESSDEDDEEGYEDDDSDDEASSVTRHKGEWPGVDCPTAGVDGDFAEVDLLRQHTTNGLCFAAGLAAVPELKVEPPEGKIHTWLAQHSQVDPAV
jgi:hypothetical protein